MAFIMLEDKTGEMEAVVFAKQFERFAGMLFVESAVLLYGTVSLKDDEPPKILLNNCMPLISNDIFEKEKPKTLYLRVPSVTSKECENALLCIGRNSDGADVVLYDMQSAKYVKAVGYKAKLSDTLLNSLYSMLGKDNIAIK